MQCAITYPYKCAIIATQTENVSLKNGPILLNVICEKFAIIKCFELSQKDSILNKVM